MPSFRNLVSARALGLTSCLAYGCGGSDAGSGSTASSAGQSQVAGDTFTSVGSEALTFAFAKGGAVTMRAEGAGTSSGTYTV